MSSVHRFLGDAQRFRRPVSLVRLHQRLDVDVAPDRQRRPKTVKILRQVELAELGQHQQAEVVDYDGQLLAVLNSTGQLLRLNAIQNLAGSGETPRHAYQHAPVAREVLGRDAGVPPDGQLLALHDTAKSLGYTRRHPCSQSHAILADA